MRHIRRFLLAAKLLLTDFVSISALCSPRRKTNKAAIDWEKSGFVETLPSHPENLRLDFKRSIVMASIALAVQLVRSLKRQFEAKSSLALENKKSCQLMMKNVRFYIY